MNGIFLDVIMLLFAGIVLFITMINGGFKPTGNEGSAVSLSLYVFLAPLFAWIGFTFLSLRLTLVVSATQAGVDSQDFRAPLRRNRIPGRAIAFAPRRFHRFGGGGHRAHDFFRFEPYDLPG